MRGNRRWYGGPVWATVLLLALVISSFAPVVLAEPVGDEGTSGGGEELPVVEVLTPSEPPVHSPPVVQTQDVPVVGSTEPGFDPPVVSNEDEPVVDAGDDDPAIVPTEAIPEEEPDEVEATETPGDEPQPAGLFSTLDEAEADLSISLTGPATVSAPGLATYTVTLTNGGDVAAENVTFRVDRTVQVFLSGLYLQGGWGPEGVSCSTSALHTTCEALSIPAGGSVMVTLFGVAPSPADAVSVCGQVVTVTPSITAAGGFWGGRWGSGLDRELGFHHGHLRGQHGDSRGPVHQLRRPDLD